MGTPLSGHKARFDIDIGQTTTFNEFVNVVSSNADVLLEQIQSSELGDDGERRTPGRNDFSADCTVNLDITDAQHRSVINACKAGTLVDVRVIPDRANAGNYIEATCRIANTNLTLSGGSTGQMSVSFQNADGSQWNLVTV